MIQSISNPRRASSETSRGDFANWEISGDGPCTDGGLCGNIEGTAELCVVLSMKSHPLYIYFYG